MTQQQASKLVEERMRELQAKKRADRCGDAGS
jgi:hypothetical protein